MKPGPTRLLEIAGIRILPIEFYDVPDPEPFEPFCTPKRCIFACFDNWANGESLCISEGSCSCRGGGYWIGGVEFATRDDFEKGLNEREGFKSSHTLMKQWLDNQPRCLTLGLGRMVKEYHGRFCPQARCLDGVSFD